MNESSKNKPNQKSDFRTVFIRCDCQNEVLVLAYDAEYSVIDLCIYQTTNSFKDKMGWWQKLRYIYQTLKYGQPFNDQIILQKKQIEELKAFLNTIK